MFTRTKNQCGWDNTGGYYIGHALHIPNAVIGVIPGVVFGVPVICVQFVNL